MRIPFLEKLKRGRGEIRCSVVSLIIIGAQQIGVLQTTNASTVNNVAMCGISQELNAVSSVVMYLIAGGPHSDRLLFTK